MSGHEPYRPPETELREPRGAESGSSVAAVLVGGAVVDFLGSLLAVVGLAIGWAVVATAEGQDVEAVLEATDFGVAATAIGLILSFAGGFVAARWARRRPLAHGFGSGALSMLLGAPFMLMPGAWEPLWLTLSGALLHLPIAVAGGAAAGGRLG